MFILQTLNPQWNEEFIFRVSHFRLYYCILDVESDVNRFSILGIDLCFGFQS